MSGYLQHVQGTGGAPSPTGARFEDPERLVLAVAGWVRPDYLVLVEILPDGTEVQRIRRAVALDEDMVKVVLAMPAAMDVAVPLSVRLYGMARGGKRLGKARAQLVPAAGVAVGEGLPVAAARGGAVRPERREALQRGDSDDWRSPRVATIAPRAASPAPRSAAVQPASIVRLPAGALASVDVGPTRPVGPHPRVVALRAENAALALRAADQQAALALAIDRAARAETSVSFLRAEVDRLREEAVAVACIVADLREENASLKSSLDEATAALEECGRFVTPIGALFARRG